MAEEAVEMPGHREPGEEHLAVCIREEDRALRVAPCRDVVDETGDEGTRRARHRSTVRSATVNGQRRGATEVRRFRPRCNIGV